MVSNAMAVMPSLGIPDYWQGLRGRLQANAPLADKTWFRVGGTADWLFKPQDADDLAAFMRATPTDIPVTILGAASNVIIRDGGIEGVVIRLGRGFASLAVEQGDVIVAGAANLDVNLAEFAALNGLGGLEFLSGIPGNLGGAVAMNAGAYGREIKDVLLKAELVTRSGEMLMLPSEAFDFAYRHAQLPDGAVVTRLWLQAVPAEKAEIQAKMQQIAEARAASQPIRARTGGSTFRNPPANPQGIVKKAWEWIDEVGGRGMMQGGAQVSEKHCNFLINTSSASAADLEQLGESLRQKVRAHAGIDLHWEIKIIGRH